MSEATPPEHPTPAMIERGVQIHQTPRSGTDETLVHDIWQAMYDEWQSEATPPAASDLERRSDGSAHISIPSLPGFHFIVSRDEDMPRCFLIALNEFVEIYIAAIRDAARAEGKSAGWDACVEALRKFSRIDIKHNVDLRYAANWLLAHKPGREGE